jgi:hypothetical protein
MPMKKSTDIIGNRTRDLPVCSAVRHRGPIPHMELDFIMQVARQLVLRSAHPWGGISEEVRTVLSGIQLCGRFVELHHFVCEFVVCKRRVEAEPFMNCERLN